MTETAEEKKPLTLESTLEEILAANPENQMILNSHHVPCLSCPMMGMEMPMLKLGDIARMYGLDAETILKDLNK